MSNSIDIWWPWRKFPSLVKNSLIFILMTDFRSDSRSGCWDTALSGPPALHSAHSHYRFLHSFRNFLWRFALPACLSLHASGALCLLHALFLFSFAPALHSYTVPALHCLCLLCTPRTWIVHAFLPAHRLPCHTSGLHTSLSFLCTHTWVYTLHCTCLHFAMRHWFCKRDICATYVCAPAPLSAPHVNISHHMYAPHARTSLATHTSAHCCSHSAFALLRFCHHISFLCISGSLLDHCIALFSASRFLL